MNQTEEEDFEDVIPPMDYVTLVSSDNYEFFVQKQTAMLSQTLRNIMYGGGNFEERGTKRIKLDTIDSKVLEKVIEYWHYRTQYSDHFDRLPKFKIEPDMAIDILVAADYLQT